MSVHWMTAPQLRQIFNESGYQERAGQDILVTVSNPHTPAAEYHQPPDTISQTLTYHESRNGKLVTVAIMHQFVLPDGTINNRAGLPDPKFVRIDDDRYKLARRTQQSTK